ncbi:MAG: glycosyltransferase family 9 protein, partial [Ferruginibacter sp.]|nr:glycosyltransferase family 9 protein [Ferruginibacter sp.]
EPVIEALSKKYSKLYVFSKYNVVFENYPIGNVIFKNKLNFTEKVIMNLERIFKTSIWFKNLDGAYERDPKCHLLEAYRRKLSLDFTLRYPKLYLTQSEKLGSKMDRKYVVLHLESFSGKNYRMVYGISWEKVVEFFNNAGFMVYQIGKEKQPIEGTIYQSTNIRDMISLINGASLFVGIDSGPSHIAASIGIPAVIFFGAVNPQFRHLMEYFNGEILQPYCEYAFCYHESGYLKEVSCKLVGDNGIPPCSKHDTTRVINKIGVILSK